MPFAQWGYKGDYDSGSLPLAGRVGEGVAARTRLAAQKFHEQFPADFISEAIDQTRGWFYSQLAISTLLFGQESRVQSREPEAPGSAGGSEAKTPTAPYPHPFRNCIVLGLMLGEDG